jgi:hypothetical protein
MGQLGYGAMLTWYDIAAGGDAEHEHWHSHEHIAERVGIAGFLKGRRFFALSGTPKYLIAYDVENFETLTSEEYLRRLNNPTPWTRDGVAAMRNTNRTLCRVTGSFGIGIGSTLLSIRLSPAPSKAEELSQWLVGGVLPGLAQKPGLVSATLLEGDEAASRTETEEKRLRSRPDDIADWVILVDGYDAEAVKSLCDGELSQARLEEHGAAPGQTVGVYILAHTISNGDLASPHQTAVRADAGSSRIQ